MLTKEEIAALLPLIQAGISATGIRVFDEGCGTLVQSAINKFKAVMATPEAPVAPVASADSGLESESRA